MSSFLSTITTKKPFKNKHGYWYVEIDGKLQSIHRLIANVFIPNPYGLTDVNHIDGDKDNNDVGNLEWVSRSNNHKHAYKIGLRTGAFIGKYGIDHPHSRAIRGVCQTTGQTLDYASIADARRNGFSASCITRVLKGRRNHHKGYAWFYIEESTHAHAA